MSAPRRPSFLLIITDQQRADYLGCAGHPVLATPNIDGIAARGMRFDRFYVANPVCMPNRATLMTGRMPSVHGVRSNGIPLALRSNTFVDLLRADGYRTALLGKSHLQNFTGLAPMQGRAAAPGLKALEGELGEACRPDADASAYMREDPASWRDEGFELPSPFYGFEHVDLCTLHGDRVGGHYRRWLRREHPEAAALVGPEHALPHHYRCPQAWRTALPEPLYPTNYVADRTIEFLEQHAAAGEERPFFAMMSIPDPHHPFTPPGRYWDLYDPADMVLPESFHRIGNQPPPTLAWVHAERVEGKVSRSGGQFVFVVEEQEAREAIALTCGMMALVDDAVGRVLARLAALGLAQDTVVIYTSDHGDFLGAHRLLLKGPLHYQCLVRVPFLWADPAAARPGAVNRALAGTVDIAPSILARAGLAPFNGMQGRDLAPELATGDDHGPGCVLIEDDQQRRVLGLDGSPRLHSLITRRWRMSIYDGTDWGELYDLEADPLEIDNLWGSPDHRDVKAELLERFVRREIALRERSPLPSARA